MLCAFILTVIQGQLLEEGGVDRKNYGKFATRITFARSNSCTQLKGLLDGIKQL